MRSPLRLIPFAVLLGTALAVPALAQPPQPAFEPYAPACEASKVSAKDSETAHNTFLLGRRYLDEGNYDKAIHYFRDAYTLDCSVHELLSKHIAPAYERKGDKAAAVNALEEYLSRVPNASDRDAIEKRIKNLKDAMAQSSSTASTAAPTTTATAAPTTTATTSPTSTTTPSHSRSIVPLVVAGGGGVLLITGGVLFAVGAGKISDAEAICGSGRGCTSANDQAKADGNTGITMRDVGAIVGGVGLAAVAGGLIWYFVQPTKKEGSAANVPRVSPVFAPGYAGVGVGGSF